MLFVFNNRFDGECRSHIRLVYQDNAALQQQCPCGGKPIVPFKIKGVFLADAELPRTLSRSSAAIRPSLTLG